MALFGTLVMRVKGTENSRSAASMLSGPFPGKCSEGDRTPEKRKVSSSILLLLFNLLDQDDEFPVSNSIQGTNGQEVYRASH